METNRSLKTRRRASRDKVRNLMDKVTPPAALDPLQEEPNHRALLAAIVDSSDDAIVSKTLEGRILSWNRGATRIFGYRPEEAIGKPITLIIPPELHAEEQQILQKLRRGERIEHFDTVRVTKDGRRIDISLTVSPVRAADGTVIAASKVARDVTERKVAEQRLRESEEALRLADRRKDEFLALLAHELRNPLAPIRYALAANRKPGRTPEQCRQAEAIIERQVSHMSRLLDDLLDVSRITRGALELKRSRTELTSVIGAAIETARPMLDEKHHTLVLDLPTQAVQLEADVVRLAQVFSNLLINAAKYTDPGGRIQLRARQEGNEVLVTVRDNGIGIPAELLPRVFTMFFQSSAALARSQGGLGVGLSLVRGLVALHGGVVEARSDGPGAGSEFTVRLPLGAATLRAGDAEAEVEPIFGDTGLKILIVDDNRDAADSCAMLLEASGHHVQTAYTARAGLELARAFRPHALLLDIGLPDMDGYQLAAKVRATPWGRGAVLVAVTGWGQEQDRQRAVAAGFDQHLVKPISAETVEQLLQSLTPRTTS
ncbi:MAG TPA: PAS domain S-box protein [Steroidobacteraceae bacterium]|nr:PAS domain S-box protein [Steroidobacteraceae bacterium]